MSEILAIPNLSFGKPYQTRLKKEALAGHILDGLSLLTPRFRRQVVKHPERIGILLQWGIGDAVLMLPLLRALRRAFPAASLELIGKSWLPELFKDENCCDRTHVLVPPWTAYTNKYLQPLAAFRDFWAQIRNLRSHEFDWLISARFDPREILQLRLMRARTTFGFRPAGGRFWITGDLGVDRTQHDAIHRSELARVVSHALGAASGDGDTAFLIDPQKQARARSWLFDRGHRSGPVLAVHSGAGHPIRRWREHHFDTVLKELDVKPGIVIFIQDPGMSHSVWDGPIRHAHWNGDLTELKTLLSVCDVFLGTDSGVMHMASAAGCKVIAIFGSAEPHWFSPSRASNSVIIKEVMPCRPCFDKCLYPTPLCIDRINDKTIATAVTRELTAL